MRLLLIDAKQFAYIPSCPTPRTKIHFQDGMGKQAIYSNCLVAHVAIEARDDETTIYSAATEIKRLAKEFAVSAIVLLPNVHLAEKPARSPKAFRLFQVLFETLADNPTCPVHLEAFGYSGEWSIVSKKHVRSVLGRRY